MVKDYVKEGKYVPSRWLQHGDYKPRWLLGQGLQIPDDSVGDEQLL